MTSPFLSIIIPAYNEEKRLPHTLDEIVKFLSQQAYTSEVLVIENGSQDKTLQIAREYSGRYPSIRAIHIDEKGKGIAVKHGMLEAQGLYRLMCDSDLSMPISQVNRFIPPMLPSLDIAIASRETKGAKRYNEPFYRHVGGRLINLMIRSMILPGLQDTQCGFKCFRASIAQVLFEQVTLTGWSFDIELLFLARLYGFEVVEIPIDWYHSTDSKLNALDGATKMLRDILEIKRNYRRGVYRSSGTNLPPHLSNSEK